jgi:hypothetical protein
MCKTCDIWSLFTPGDKCSKCQVIKSAKQEKPYWVRLAEQAGLL